jgi:hypothetical protein
MQARRPGVRCSTRFHRCDSHARRLISGYPCRSPRSPGIISARSIRRLVRLSSWSPGAAPRRNARRRQAISAESGAADGVAQLRAVLLNLGFRAERLPLTGAGTVNFRVMTSAIDVVGVVVQRPVRVMLVVIVEAGLRPLFGRRNVIRHCILAAQIERTDGIQVLGDPERAPVHYACAVRAGCVFAMGSNLA